jgi:hypothetical protein
MKLRPPDCSDVNKRHGDKAGRPSAIADTSLPTVKVVIASAPSCPARVLS